MIFGTKKKIEFLVIFLRILNFNQATKPPKNASAAKIQDALDDPSELLYREISDEAFFNLPSRRAEYDVEHSRRLMTSGPWLMEKVGFPAEMRFENENSPGGLLPAWEAVDYDREITDQRHKDQKTLNPDAFTIFHLCYAVSYIYRKGRKRLHRHFSLRDIYADHLQFELGYMTQVIMATYQNVLELYEYSTKLEGPENKIGTAHLFNFYKNILDDCKKIIHMCNMMHEVTRKYRVLQYSEVSGSQWIPVTYDPTKKFQETSGNYLRSYFWDYKRDFERGIQGFEYQKIDHEDPAVFEFIKKTRNLNEAERMRRKKLAKPKRQDFVKHGYFSWNTTIARVRPTRTWKPKDDALGYGWSREKY